MSRRAVAAPMTRKGWALFVAMCVIWGLPYLLIKVAVADLTPATLVFLRTAIGALILVPVVAVRVPLATLRPHWRVIALYTLVEIGVPWFLLSDAERHLSSSLSGLLVAAVPLIGAVIALGLGSADRLDLRRFVGLLIGVAGVAALLGLDIGGGDLGAVAEIGVVTVCYATGPVIIARRLSGLPASAVVAASLVLTALVYAPIAAVQHPAAMPSLRVLLAMATLGALCTSVAFVMFFALIAEVGPVRATVISYVNPAVAVALGVTVLGEPFTLGTALGFSLILAGSYLATRSGRPASDVAASPREPAPREASGPAAP